MELKSEIEAGICVLTVQSARIDAAAALAFKEGVRAAVKEGPNTVVLDLSSVTFIDSSGLGAIVASMKLLAPDKTLILAGLGPTVQKVFQLTRMDQVFTLHKTRAEALAAHGDASCNN